MQNKYETPKVPKIKALIPVPDDAPPVETAFPLLPGMEMYRYIDAQGDTLFYNYRFLGKSFPTYYTENGWTRIDDGPLALYGELAAGLTLVVPDEKTVEKALKRFDGIGAVTWPNAPQKGRLLQAVEGVTFAVFAPNHEAGDEFAARLQAAANVKVYLHPESARPGADIDDVPSVDFLLANLFDAAERAPFKVLGKRLHESGYEYAIQVRTYGIMYVKPADIRPEWLLSLYPSTPYWQDLAERVCPTEGEKKDYLTRKDVLKIIEYIDAEALRRPPFNPAALRGLGVWDDNGLIAVNYGDKVRIGEKTYPPGHVTDYVYRQRPPLKAAAPAAEFNPRPMAEICESLFWKDPVYGPLLGGWLAAAPVCGVLPWRPHVWVTGESGSGKSWVVRFVRKALHGFHYAFQSEQTTEAGIRQTTATDALPVVFDEADVSPERKGAFQNVLALARVASTDDAPSIVKGTQSHKHVEFSCRGMFLFSSIVPQTFNDADKNRFSLLELQSEAEIDKAEKLRVYKRTAALIDAVKPGLFGFTLSRVDALIATAREFAVRLSVDHGLNQRAADQLSVLTAGWFLLTGQDVVDAAARSFLGKNTLMSAHDRVWEYFVNHRIESTDWTLGKALHQYTVESNAFAQQKLESYGIMADARFVYLPSNSVALDKIFVGTEYAAGWREVLSRTPGAQKGVTKRDWNHKPRKFLAVPHAYAEDAC